MQIEAAVKLYGVPAVLVLPILTTLFGDRERGPGFEALAGIEPVGVGN